MRLLWLIWMSPICQDKCLSKGETKIQQTSWRGQCEDSREAKQQVRECQWPQELEEMSFFLHTPGRHPDLDFRPVLIRTPESC